MGRRLDTSTCPSPQKCKTARSTLPIFDPSRFTAAWWRVYASACARSEVLRNWRLHAMPAEICRGAGAAGPGTEQWASRLFDGLTEHGMLAAIDYKQAFDLCDPVLAGHCIIIETGSSGVSFSSPGLSVDSSAAHTRAEPIWGQGSSAGRAVIPIGTFVSPVC